MSGAFAGKSVSKAFHALRPMMPMSVVDRFKSYLNEKIAHPSLIVDIGCGTGLSTTKIATAFPSPVKIIGLDVSPTQIDQAKRFSPMTNIEYQVHNSGTVWPFESDQVDLITVVQALHWFDLEKFWVESNRVLKPNGVLALCSYSLIRPLIDEFSDEQNRTLANLIKNVYEM